MSKLPLEHLSASSLALHMKCPRMWQDKYVLGHREPTNGGMFLGTVVHLGIKRMLDGSELGDPWNDALEEEESQINWSPRDNTRTMKQQSQVMIQNYYDLVGKYLRVVETEKEILFRVPGVDVPILGYIDLITDRALIDYKSTAFMSPKSVRLNAEWVFQQFLYQLEVPKPSEIHVITRKGDVIYPDSLKHSLNLGRGNDQQTIAMVQEQWREMNYHLEAYGENPWPGKRLHEYANKYCKLPNCCSA